MLANTKLIFFDLQLKEQQAVFAQQTADAEERLQSAAAIQVSVLMGPQPWVSP